jgi:hypothetical protein
VKAQSSTGPTSKLARWVMACVGFLFLLGAINKMAEPLSAMGHMPVSFARPLQLAIVLTLELFIGLALVLLPSHRTIWTAILLLTAFCAYLLLPVYAGAESCGCFDSLGIRRSPLLALLTNLAAICGLALCLRRIPPRPWTRHEGILALVIASLAFCFTYGITRQPGSLVLEHMLGPQATGRDILLKVSPTCDECRQATHKVLSNYPARRVIAITHLDAGRFKQEYAEQFHIPLVVVAIKDFFALDGTLEVPQCYQIQGTNLVRLEIKSRL